MRSRFPRYASMASLALAIAISAPAAAQVDTGNEQLMNLVLQMQC